jgi:hypothetical protein
MNTVRMRILTGKPAVQECAAIEGITTLMPAAIVMTMMTITGLKTAAEDPGTAIMEAEAEAAKAADLPAAITVHRIMVVMKKITAEITADPGITHLAGYGGLEIGTGKIPTVIIMRWMNMIVLTPVIGEVMQTAALTSAADANLVAAMSVIMTIKIAPIAADTPTSINHSRGEKRGVRRAFPPSSQRRSTCISATR